MGAEGSCIAGVCSGGSKKTRGRSEEMANHWISVITLWMISSPSTRYRYLPGWGISKAVLLYHSVRSISTPGI